MKRFILTLSLLAVLLAGGFSSFAKTILSGVINVNTANAEQLMLLPGVGEAKAKLIIEARTQKPFSKKEDLLEVKGIGEKTLIQWNEYIAFDGKTTLSATQSN